MAYATQRFAFGYQLTPWVKRLLIANTVVFLITRIVGDVVITWFAFWPTHVLTRPWGALTYMFLHGNVWHLLLNMLVLFFFGPPLESRWGSSEFLKYYLLCGLGGVALSFVFLSQGVPIIGASAAIFGLMLAFAWYWPEAPIYVWGIFPVKAKWLVGFFFVLTFISAFEGGGGNIAHFAHLGGLLTGLAYLKFGDRLSARLGEIRSSRATELFAIVPRKEATAEEGHGSSRSKRRTRSSRGEEELLDEVDRILDKISARGMGALTEDERKVLDEVSKKRRSN